MANIQVYTQTRASVNYGHEYQYYESPTTGIRALALPRTDPKCFFRYIHIRGIDLRIIGGMTNAGDWFSVYSKGYVGKIPKVGRDSGSLPLTFNGIEDIFNYGSFGGFTLGDVNFGFLMARSL